MVLSVSKGILTTEIQHQDVTVKGENWLSGLKFIYKLVKKLNSLNSKVYGAFDDVFFLAQLSCFMEGSVKMFPFPSGRQANMGKADLAKQTFTLL